jgi:hypothetical protein
MIVGSTLRAMPGRLILVAVVAALGAGVALAGCGRARGHAAGREMNRRGSSPSQQQLTDRAPASLARGALAPVGTSQRVDAAGAHLTVTLREVIDPLRRSGAGLQPGTRAVGVIMQIRSSGPGVYDSSATGDISVLASSGAVTPALATRGVCKTPLNDFDRYITAGEDRVGCVVFAVDNGATLDAVRFSPYARARGRLTWAP